MEPTINKQRCCLSSSAQQCVAEAGSSHTTELKLPRRWKQETETLQPNHLVYNSDNLPSNSLENLLQKPKMTKINIGTIFKMKMLKWQLYLEMKSRAERNETSNVLKILQSDRLWFWEVISKLRQPIKIYYLTFKKYILIS